MPTESYTPGHTPNASDFMSKRSLASHGAFFEPYLRPEMCVLDAGCGPGSITQGIALRVAPAEVVGVDFAESQIDRAKNDADERGVQNIRFFTTDCYSLPFENETFDCVFSHALLEQARYECYQSLSFICEYLALQLRRNGHERHADTLIAWSRATGGLFAQAWVSAIGKK